VCRPPTNVEYEIMFRCKDFEAASFESRTIGTFVVYSVTALICGARLLVPIFEAMRRSLQARTCDQPRAQCTYMILYNLQTTGKALTTSFGLYVLLRTTNGQPIRAAARKVSTYW
jgi:hypothetical protein